MAPSRFIALVIGVALSLLGYIAFKKTSFEIDFSIIISDDLESVFEHLRNPQTLPKINPYVRWVRVQNLTVTKDKVEYRQYQISEEITHIGPQTWTVSSVVNPASHTVTLRSQVMYGMLRVNTVYEVKSKTGLAGTTAATVVEEASTVEVPWILESFANKTLLTSHRQLLDMLKFVLEDRIDTKS